MGKGKWLLEDELGDVIQKARFGTGITESALARKAGVSEEKIRLLESYRYFPDIGELKALAYALSLSEDKLVRFASGKHKPKDRPNWLGKKDAPLELITLGGQNAIANCYVIGNPLQNSCLIIDPSVAASLIERTIQEKGWQIAAVLVTHNHHDHIVGVNELRQKRNCSYIDGRSLEKQLTFGNYSLEILPTPGHTPDSITFFLHDVCFVGDLLFAGSVGRAQNGSRDYPTLIESVRKVLAKKPELICPGHGPLTTSANETFGNPFVI